ncbi:MAG: hypothetical protein K9N23_18640 [Akkermansiaceae bacterium]|nr:hypothetical protein [Akkermansiaceae bacterium]
MVDGPPLAVSWARCAVMIFQSLGGVFAAVPEALNGRKGMGRIGHFHGSHANCRSKNAQILLFSWHKLCLVFISQLKYRNRLVDGISIGKQILWPEHEKPPIIHPSIRPPGAL